MLSVAHGRTGIHDARQQCVVLNVALGKPLSILLERFFAVLLPVILQVGYISRRQSSDGAGTPKEQRICTTGTASGNSYFLTT
jgi:hypothetical protein